MKVAIMQPYFFPYLPYWQLMHSVDKFVIYDDVNFIKKGYVNRNNFLVNGQSQLITLQLLGASQNKLINEISIGGNRDKVLKTIELAYKKAPHYLETIDLVRQIMEAPSLRLSEFLSDSIFRISRQLGMSTDILLSSDIDKNTQLKGQEKILQIVKKLNGTHYVNSIGGRDMYQREVFLANGLDLSFIMSKNSTYDQGLETFVPNLSIIDLLMFNDPHRVTNMLRAYELGPG